MRMQIVPFFHKTTFRSRSLFVLKDQLFNQLILPQQQQQQHKHVQHNDDDDDDTNNHNHCIITNSQSIVATFSHQNNSTATTVLNEIPLDDLVSGNKIRKLFHLMQRAPGSLKKIVSVGGNQSNAMVALAALCHLKGWQFEYHTPKLPHSLSINAAALQRDEPQHQHPPRPSSSSSSLQLLSNLGVAARVFGAQIKQFERRSNSCNSNRSSSSNNNNNNNESATTRPWSWEEQMEEICRGLSKSKPHATSNNNNNNNKNCSETGNSLQEEEEEEEVLFVPLGGAMPEAEDGLRRLAEDINDFYCRQYQQQAQQQQTLIISCSRGKPHKMLVLVSAGTGTTAYYLAKHLSALQPGRIFCVAVPCAGDTKYLLDQMKHLHDQDQQRHRRQHQQQQQQQQQQKQQQDGRSNLNHHHHNNNNDNDNDDEWWRFLPENLVIVDTKKRKYAFAKPYPEFLDIWNEWNSATGIEVDLIYAPKLLLTVFGGPPPTPPLIQQQQIEENSDTVVVTAASHQHRHFIERALRSLRQRQRQQQQQQRHANNNNNNSSSSIETGVGVGDDDDESVTVVYYHCGGVFGNATQMERYLKKRPAWERAGGSKQ